MNRRFFFGASAAGLIGATTSAATNSSVFKQIHNSIANIFEKTEGIERDYLLHKELNNIIDAITHNKITPKEVIKILEQIYECKEYHNAYTDSMCVYVFCFTSRYKRLEFRQAFLDYIKNGGFKNSVMLDRASKLLI